MYFYSSKAYDTEATPQSLFNLSKMYLNLSLYLTIKNILFKCDSYKEQGNI